MMNQELALYELKKSYMQLYSIEIVFFMVPSGGYHDPWIKGKDKNSGDILIHIYQDGSWGGDIIDIDIEPRVYQKIGYDPSLMRRITS